MRALVTGASGYLGSRLVAALAARGDVDEVVDVDVAPPRAPLPRVRFERRSVTDGLSDLFRGVDVALHLVWTVNPLRDRHDFQYSAEKREAEGMFRRFAGSGRERCSRSPGRWWWSAPTSPTSSSAPCPRP